MQSWRECRRLEAKSTAADCRFLLARYNVTWHRLRGLQNPLRIGDVLILPITAFSPGGQPDFQSGSPDSPQADVLHNCELTKRGLPGSARHLDWIDAGLTVQSEAAGRAKAGSGRISHRCTAISTHTLCLEQWDERSDV